jgi:hypothetical protein
VVKGFSSWNRTKVATLPNGKYLEIKMQLIFLSEVHLSSIQYLLENSLIQASLSLSIRYYFLKARRPYQISIPVLILSMNEYQYNIIGAGLSGIGAACHLSRKIPKTYIILEARTEVGGTWSFNTPVFVLTMYTFGYFLKHGMSKVFR